MCVASCRRVLRHYANRSSVGSLHRGAITDTTLREPGCPVLIGAMRLRVVRSRCVGELGWTPTGIVLIAKFFVKSISGSLGSEISNRIHAHDGGRAQRQQIVGNPRARADSARWSGVCRGWCGSCRAVGGRHRRKVAWDTASINEYKRVSDGFRSGAATKTTAPRRYRLGAVTCTIAFACSAQGRRSVHPLKLGLFFSSVTTGRFTSFP